MANQKATGLKRILNAFKYSWQGLVAAYQNEQAFRQELVKVALGIPLALWWGDNGLEYALLISTLIIILIAELVNSALEAVVDRFGGEIHQLSGRAKDMGSAVVLLAFVNHIVVWTCVLYDDFLAFLATL
ncbi:MAG: diacylglycerol kinase [Gammaproteobacteria bacterium]|nr:diacylglycerol kinase [Gammaproteobacteria bacterium]NNC97130.1 diacylglycerol kinase [Gammaproteobacteria bacterium]NNM13618.1 diacylglycerol kinase [Gammaproteobacteria bacterium]